jgi:hypothetical protein
MSEQVDQVEFLVPLGPMRSLGIVDLPPDRTGASWAVATADLAGTNLAARAGLRLLNPFPVRLLFMKSQPEALLPRMLQLFGR